MKRLTLVAAFATGLASSTPARAQFGHGHGPATPHAGGFTYAGAAGFASRGYGYRVSGFGGGYYSRSVFLTPAGFPVFPFAPPGWGSGPWGSGFGGTFWGGGWGLTTIVPPPIIIVPPPIILAGNAQNDPYSPPDRPVPLAEESVPLGAKPGDHFVIRPRKDVVPPGQIVAPPGQIAPRVDRVAAVARPRMPAFAFDPFADRKLVNVDRPDPDPAKEVARLITLGRKAFAAGEFGGAGEHFDRAIAVDPKAALPHFLNAQATFAAGRFADAVTAIRAGLALDGTWPATAFDPKDLYGVNPAAFADHLADLKRAVAANPGNATLEFLLGYQLWLTGDKVEAKKLFAAAEKRLPAPGLIALFK